MFISLIFTRWRQKRRENVVALDSPHIVPLPSLIGEESSSIFYFGITYLPDDYQAGTIDPYQLFEKKPSGLLDLLDEESRLPRPTPQHYTMAAYGSNKGHFRLESPRRSRLRQHRDLREDEAFLVRHYAGTVCYQTAQFLDKNNDTLHNSLEFLVEQSRWIYCFCSTALSEKGRPTCTFRILVMLEQMLQRLLPLVVFYSITVFCKDDDLVVPAVRVVRIQVDYPEAAVQEIPKIHKWNSIMRNSVIASLRFINKHWIICGSGPNDERLVSPPVFKALCNLTVYGVRFLKDCKTAHSFRGVRFLVEENCRFLLRWG
ncbi:unnamed protein product [Haemonchus placei]|uniref:Myosin motor domain-containing protein n=1 Tax=Haemonchus placei TaxID=6290 RepID=A0A0N4X260_HAEPC|nr:unnamed protein product [Haemonchus placei]